MTPQKSIVSLEETSPEIPSRGINNVSLEEYWQRRLEREQARAGKLLADKDEEILRLKTRLAEQKKDVDIVRREFADIRAEMEEIRQKENNPPFIPSKNSADDAQSLKEKIYLLQREAEKWKREAGQARLTAQKAALLQREKEEWEAKALQGMKDAAPLRDENARLRKIISENAGAQKERWEIMGRGLAQGLMPSLSSMADILGKSLAGGLSPAQREILSALDRHARVILKSVEDFLFLAATPRLDKMKLDLRKFLEQGISLWRTGAPGRRWTFLPSEDAPSVVADPRLLWEALDAAASNARDASPSDGEITVSTERNAAWRAVLIHLDDAGPGMADDVLNKAFEPYFSTKEGRRGLGLSLCRRALEIHGGAVLLNSAPGEGCRVTLVLPDDEEAA